MLTLEFEEHRTNEQGKEQFEEYDSVSYTHLTLPTTERV